MILTFTMMLSQCFILMLSFQTRGKGELERKVRRAEREMRSDSAQCSHIWAGPVLCCTALYCAVQCPCHNITPRLTPTPGHQLPVIGTGGGTSLKNIGCDIQWRICSQASWHSDMLCSSDEQSGVFRPCCVWDWVTKIRLKWEWVRGWAFLSQADTDTVLGWR